MAVIRHTTIRLAAKRSTCGRVAALAAGCAALWASSLAFAGPAVLDRPAAKDRRVGAAAGTSDAPEPSETRASDAARAGSDETQYPAEASLLGSSEDKPVALNPLWATCFVRSEAEGRSVLEEWQMRGERKNVESFRSWRQASAAGQVNVNCVEATHTADDDVMCMECLTASAAYPAGNVATLGAPITTTFVGAQQCVASVLGGTGFCKSGQVVV